SAPACTGLGGGYRRVGRYDDAERAFQRYIALIRSEPNPYDSYAELLLKTSRYAKSIEMYRKALSLDPHFNSSRAGIAANLMYQGKYTVARAEAQKLVKAARDDGERRAAFRAVAIVCLDAGHGDRALRPPGPRYAGAKRG